MSTHTSRRPTTGARSRKRAQYEATFLYAEEGKRLAKLYRDPTKRPLDYDAGTHFQALEMRFASFAEFCATLAEMPADACLIRGGVREDARGDVEQGLHVRRLAYDAEDCAAAFEERARNWIVLDVDGCDTPFDSEHVERSIDRWRKTLPDELREAQSAFFLSASSHLSETVRGKLVVALRAALDNASAAAYVKSLGFDPCLSHTVQPNFFARPIFVRCADPLAAHRGAFIFAGKPARLPAIDARKVAGERKRMAGRERVPKDLPPLSKRAGKLAETIVDTWLNGGRIETNGWLHLCGWLLGKGWDKGEIGTMLRLLDNDEPNAAKRAEHWHILSNARAIEGPGGAREWLGKTFSKIDRQLKRDPVMREYSRRLKQRADEAKRATRTASEHPEQDVDPWENFESFTAPERPIEYFCPGLRLAPSKGKVSMIAGYGGAGKGPIANHLAMCFALGLDAFGAHPCRKSRVLMLDCEGTFLTMRRLRRMARGVGHEPAELQRNLLVLSALELGDLTSEANQERLAELVQRMGVEVLVLDSYTSAMLATGIDDKSPEYAILAQQLGRLGILVLCVVHKNKSSARDDVPRLQDIAYTGALGSLAQTALMVHYPDELEKNVVRIGCARAPETSFASFDVRFADDDNDSLTLQEIPEPHEGATAAGEDGAPTTRKIRDEMAAIARHSDRVIDTIRRVDVLRNGMSARKLRDICGLNARVWGETRAELLRRGAIVERSLPSDPVVKISLAHDGVVPDEARERPAKPRAPKLPPWRRK